jgi:hypothetical protein
MSSPAPALDDRFTICFVPQRPRKTGGRRPCAACLGSGRGAVVLPLVAPRSHCGPFALEQDLRPRDPEKIGLATALGAILRGKARGMVFSLSWKSRENY